MPATGPATRQTGPEVTGVWARRLALAVAALVLAGLWVGGARANGWSGDGLVRAVGGPYLTDSLGRRLELHGANLVGKCGGGAVPEPVPGTPCVGPDTGPAPAYVLSPTATDPARRFTPADAQTLASLGFNVVRLGIVWEGLEPGPSNVGPNDSLYCSPHRLGTRFPALGAADPYDAATVRAYLARTRTIVSELARAGLRVIIDMHSDVYGSAFSEAAGTTPWNGEGAPPWATCTDDQPFVPSPGWGDGYESPAVQAAIHHFFANDVRGDLQGQFARVWRAVAEYFRGNRDVIGYEVYNEPNDFLVSDFDAELTCDYGGPAHEPWSCAASGTQPVPDGLIGTIERADPGHVVLFEPSGATNFGEPETLGMSESLRFPRLALAFHVYGSIPQQLGLTAVERERTRTDEVGGPPWIMDEFGGIDESGPAPVVAWEADAAVALADAYNVSWAYWSAMQLDDPTGADADEGLLDQVTRQPYPAVAQALAVPYPWATAGRPGSQSFDYATKTFDYTYVPDHRIQAPTEISIPAYTYPGGYVAEVRGGRIVSSAGAPILRIAADRGRTVVRVSLRPA